MNSEGACIRKKVILRESGEMKLDFVNGSTFSGTLSEEMAA